MIRRLFFISLLLCISIFLIRFSIKGGREWLAYGRLSTQAEGTLQTCEVVQKSSHAYFLVGKLLVNGQEMKVSLKGPLPNRYIAEESKTDILPIYPVFFDEKNPEKGVLKRALPFKTTLSFALLLALLCYFLFLGFYVERRVVNRKF